MESKYALALLALILFVFSGSYFLGASVQKHELQGKAILAGVAEYYIDSDNNVAFRYIPCEVKNEVHE